MLAYVSSGKLVLAASDTLPTDVYFGLLCGVDGSHYNLCFEQVAADNGARFGYDECAKLVHAYVFHVDIRHECV